MYNEGTANNGNLAVMYASYGQSFYRSFGYDSINRLSTMNDSFASMPCRGLSWTYDPWGNRTDQTVTGGTCNTFHQSVDANNRFNSSPYQYDAAGNMIHDATHSYAYDAENRLVSVDGGSTAAYVYDAMGHRVQKIAAGSTTNYFYDLGGNVISEISPSSWLNVYLRLNGKLFAQYTLGTPRTQFVFTDHLGSARLLTTMTQSVQDSYDYLPFGELVQGGSYTTHKFTEDEHDSESNLDHTQFRQYSSSLGRWMTPDPAGLAAVDPANPQSWNRYSYVLNNPLIYVDPSGLIWACTTIKGDTVCVYYGDDQFTSSAGGGQLTGPRADRGTDRLDVKSLQEAAERNACLSQYNNSVVGQATQFLSLYDLATHANSLKTWLEWTALPYTKVKLFTWTAAASRVLGNTEFWSLTSGATAPSVTIEAPTAAGIETIESAGAYVAPIAIIGATIADIQMHAACAGYNNNRKAFLMPTVF